MKTRSTTTEDARAQRRWFVVDAKGKVVGRLASEIAHVLRGKHRTTFTPSQDTGDFVVVVNAAQAVFTGRKEQQKEYHHHTGHPGGIVTRTPAKLREEKPTAIIEKAVWGMMPKGPLGRACFGKLKTYAGAEHPHQAQQPLPLAQAPQAHRTSPEAAAPAA